MTRKLRISLYVLSLTITVAVLVLLLFHGKLFKQFGLQEAEVQVSTEAEQEAKLGARNR